MVETYQMMVCGVGGQGILTITDIIVMAAQKKGLRVLGSEVHGMAQKGGSVVTNLKIGKELHSPVTPIGSCKALVGLEQNETLRYLKYLEPEGTVITSKTVLFPISWKKDKKAAQLARDKIEENLAKYNAKILRIDAEELAIEAGLVLTQNIVLLGALSQVKGFPLTVDELREALKLRVPTKYIEQNVKAFELGIISASNS
ncbi:MAG: indolepyruvate oxidoreductase subunit beta [Candidatus Heimdallarchaeota archaeon]|nr:indolepyruvate oxidoreductase subunit beta [Candidatus Heimdallarchaeota archaeon]